MGFVARVVSRLFLDPESNCDLKASPVHCFVLTVQNMAYRDWTKAVITRPLCDGDPSGTELPHEAGFELGGCHVGSDQSMLSCVDTYFSPDILDLQGIYAEL